MPAGEIDFGVQFAVFCVRVVIGSVVGGAVFHVAAHRLFRGRRWVPPLWKTILLYTPFAICVLLTEWVIGVLAADLSAEGRAVVGLLQLVGAFFAHWGWAHLVLRHATPRQSLRVTALAYGILLGALLMILLVGWAIVTLTWR